MITYQKINSVNPFNMNAYLYNNFQYILHFHKDIELVYVYDGELTATIDNNTFTIKKGGFALILPNQTHSYETKEYSKAWVCVFSQDYVNNFANTIKNKTADNLFNCEPDVKEFLINNFIEFDFENLPDTYRQQRLCAMFSLICSEFLRCNELTKANKHGVSLYNKIVEYITENYTENISLDTLSKHLGYEKHYVSKYFNKCFKTNFKKFINEYRINLAKELLKSKTIQITDISYKTGFGSVRSFNRAFKEIAGITPTEYLET